eukprot:CAMPEP_0116973488 /NCGR_PEP_ID=MMETSP0467-20121206/54529_1 /TAXON_ID=283647 /ORGANISM="Mesodinium pulex, Strain SPMC105" /LENGTH=117 /DNA_ID=CAMNT_0004665303 /DNA_START=180 /DNA_END=533 /DNA_ORIENTATION=+
MDVCTIIIFMMMMMMMMMDAKSINSASSSIFVRDEVVSAHESIRVREEVGRVYAILLVLLQHHGVDKAPVAVVHVPPGQLHTAQVDGLGRQQSSQPTHFERGEQHSPCGNETNIFAP